MTATSLNLPAVRSATALITDYLCRVLLDAKDTLTAAEGYAEDVRLDSHAHNLAYIAPWAAFLLRYTRINGVVAWTWASDPFQYGHTLLTMQEWGVPATATYVLHNGHWAECDSEGICLPCWKAYLAEYRAEVTSEIEHNWLEEAAEASFNHTELAQELAEPALGASEPDYNPN
jgi:hypothetical protein